MKKFIFQLWFLLTVDCVTSARLTSESFDRDLNWAEHWGMKLHRLICSKSRLLDTQMQMIQSALKDRWTRNTETDLKLPEDAKLRIKKRIQELS